MPQRYTKPKGKDRKGEQRFAPDPNKYLFNIDTLHYTIEIRNYDAIMDAGLRQRLEDGLSHYYDSEEGELLNTIEVPLQGYENPVVFEIMSGSRGVGRYSIRNKDYAFYFRKSDNVPGTYPVKVQINQYKLWSMGFVDAYVESLQILSALAFEWGKAKPSRVDLCVHSDQFHWTYEDLQDFLYPRDVTNSNHPNWIHLDPTTGEFETVYYGSRNTGMILRMYNKSLESKKKDKPYFRELYQEKGLDPDKVWNIEFEITRKYLKDFINPDTFDQDFYDDMENLLSERGLSFLWTFLTTKFVHPSAHWSTIQKGDITKFTLLKENMVRHKDIDASKMREVAQIRGRLMKMILKEATKNGGEVQAAIDVFKNLLTEYEREKDKDFVEDLTRRRLLYVDSQINSLGYQKKAKELTGHVHQVAEIEERILDLDIEKLQIERKWYHRTNNIQMLAAVDKELERLEKIKSARLDGASCEHIHNIS